MNALDLVIQWGTLRLRADEERDPEERAHCIREAEKLKDILIDTDVGEQPKEQTC